MSKRTYEFADVDHLLAAACERAEQNYVLAIDVAKEKQVGCLVPASGALTDVEQALFVRFTTMQTLPLLRRLQQDIDLEAVVLEPTGSYSDPLAEAVRQQQLPLWWAQPKQTHDARRLHDGHWGIDDPKAAFVIAWVHRCLPTVQDRPRHSLQLQLRALEDLLELSRHAIEQTRQRLEARTASIWPGLSRHLGGWNSATLLALLARFGGPAALLAQQEEAIELMRRVSRNRLSEERIEQVIELAEQALEQGLGCQVEEQREALRRMAQRMQSQRKERSELERRIKELLEQHPEQVPPSLLACAGPALSAALTVHLGAAGDYPSAASYVKAMGLNLVPSQSGESKQGPVRISKVGPARVRQLLYMCVQHLLHPDYGCEHARGWFLRYTSRHQKGGHKGMVALMRKLARALWHVGQGAPYQGEKLFSAPPNVRRYHLSA